MKAAADANGRYVALLSMRGVLALWVVIFHFQDALEKLFLATAVFSPLFSLGYLAVPAFFVLSGFVLSLSHGQDFSSLHWRSYIRYILLRFARIYPVHITTLLLCLALVLSLRCLNLLDSMSGFSKSELIRSVFLLQMWRPEVKLSWNYPSWSISSEWFAYLVFPLLAWNMARLRGRLSKTGFGAGIVAFGIGGIWYYSGGYNQAYFGMVCVLPFFIAGMCLFEAQLQISERHRVLVAHFSWMPVLVIAIVAYTLPPGSAKVVVMGVLVLLIVGLVLVEHATPRLWSHPILLALGEASYSLYMTHALAQLLLYQILPAERFADSSIVTRIGVLLLYIGVIAAACLACYRWVELPSRRRLKKAINQRLSNNNQAPATRSLGRPPALD